MQAFDLLSESLRKERIKGIQKSIEGLKEFDKKWTKDS